MRGVSDPGGVRISLLGINCETRGVGVVKTLEPVIEVDSFVAPDAERAIAVSNTERKPAGLIFILCLLAGDFC